MTDTPLNRPDAWVVAALSRAIPLLIRLGDFVGNDHERCETIGFCRDTLKLIGGETIYQPQSSDLPPPFVPTMANASRATLVMSPNPPLGVPPCPDKAIGYIDRGGYDE